MIRNNLDVRRYNESIIQLCDYLNLTYIDIYNSYDSKKDLDEIDGLHPNASRHQKIFDSIIKLFDSKY
jgi:lysophospholipase L1-like esterase